MTTSCPGRCSPSFRGYHAITDNGYVSILILHQLLCRRFEHLDLRPHDAYGGGKEPLGCVCRFGLDVDFTRQRSQQLEQQRTKLGEEDAHMNQSLALPSFTIPSNSGCRNTSLLTLSSRSLSVSTLTAFVFGSTRMTPGEKHDANFSARCGGTGFDGERMIVGRRR